MLSNAQCNVGVEKKKRVAVMWKEIDQQLNKKYLQTRVNVKAGKKEKKKKKLPY